MIDSTINQIRWYFKKRARKIIINCSKRWSKSQEQGLRPKIYVLTYHKFTFNKYDPVSVKPNDFEDQIKWLKKNAEIINAIKIERYLKNPTLLRKKSVLITIDDGHRSFYENA